MLNAVCSAISRAFPQRGQFGRRKSDRASRSNDAPGTRHVNFSDEDFRYADCRHADSWSVNGIVIADSPRRVDLLEPPVTSLRLHLRSAVSLQSVATLRPLYESPVAPFADNRHPPKAIPDAIAAGEEQRKIFAVRSGVWTMECAVSRT
jgi:hypothetical protein